MCKDQLLSFPLSLTMVILRTFSFHLQLWDCWTNLKAWGLREILPFFFVFFFFADFFFFPISPTQPCFIFIKNTSYVEDVSRDQSFNLVTGFSSHVFLAGMEIWEKRLLEAQEIFFIITYFKPSSVVFLYVLTAYYWNYSLHALF